MSSEPYPKPPRKRSIQKRNPSKLTAPVMDQIVGMIRAGNYFSVACRSAGISVGAATDWLVTGETGGPLKPRPIYRRFAEAVREAEAAAEAHAVLVVRKAINEGDSRAAIEYLRRRHPERWGDRGQVEQTITVVRQATPQELAAFAGEGEVIDADSYEELEGSRDRYTGERVLSARRGAALPAAQDVDIAVDVSQVEARPERSEAGDASAVERHVIDAGRHNGANAPDQGPGADSADDLS